MYNINEFCNIITNLRKEHGWTQAVLADKLDISPQSISKWECGVGYPDITFFPVMAELFGVSIDVLFGAKQTTEDKMESNSNYESNNERHYVFEPLGHISVYVGNPCRIEVIDGAQENSTLDIQGDATFLKFISVEKENGSLYLSIKNPNCSDSHWTPYDKEGYTGDNIVRINTGVHDSDVNVTNYLDLALENEPFDGNTYTWVCSPLK